MQIHKNRRIVEKMVINKSALLSRGLHKERMEDVACFVCVVDWR
jgi:hypothetical protein